MSRVLVAGPATARRYQSALGSTAITPSSFWPLCLFHMDAQICPGRESSGSGCRTMRGRGAVLMTIQVRDLRLVAGVDAGGGIVTQAQAACETSRIVVHDGHIRE